MSGVSTNYQHHGQNKNTCFLLPKSTVTFTSKTKGESLTTINTGDSMSLLKVWPNEHK